MISVMYSLSFEDMVIPLEEHLKILKQKNFETPMLKELNKVDNQINKILQKIYKNLEPWQYVLVARHTERPTGSDYIQNLITDFVPVSGDRTYKNDNAIVCGIGKFEGINVAVAGHKKGKNIDERVDTNFGMAHPEGYRKVARLFKLASKFNLPIVTFIDTIGAAANKEAEERGQSYALAQCIKENLRLEVPLISLIVGEGGSGGAIALSSGHCTMMLSYSVFSVASPDTCAVILCKDRNLCSETAKALKITVKDLIKIGAVDKEIIEPFGGAHRFPDKTYFEVRKSLKEELIKLKKLSSDELQEIQYKKFGSF